MSIPPSRHLLLCQRKALYGRLLFFQEVEPNRRTIETSGSPSAKQALNALQQFVVGETNFQLRNRVDNQQLDDFLSDLAGKIAGHPNVSDAGNLITDPLKTFQSKANQFSCGDCNTIRVCDGKEEDHETVAEWGLCVRPFRDLFEFAVDVTRTYYKHYATQFDLSAAPAIRFATRYCGTEKPHGVPFDAFVGGTTRFLGPSQEISEVRLDFSVDNFDWYTYLACLYVFLHECICHAYPGILPSPHGRKPVSHHDSFADGWMDWVAARVMEEVLEGRGLAPSIALKISHRSDRLKIGNGFHNARGDWRHSRRSDDAVWVGWGHIAADKTLKLLEKILKSQKASNPQEESWAAFLRLSFDLNLQQKFSRLERHKFVTVLDQHLKPQDPKEREYFDTLRIFSNYLRNKDIDGFISDVATL